MRHDSLGSAWTFSWRPWTGAEAEPEEPAGFWDQVRDHDDRLFLEMEYRAARIAWGQARFLRQAVPMLRAAAPAWQAHADAAAAMDAAFTALRDAPQSQWPCLALRLAEAQDEAGRTARAWDEAAAGLARAERDHLRDVGEENELTLAGAAESAGLDISPWEMEAADEYPGGYSWSREDWPAIAQTLATVGRQKEMLKNADELAGLRGAV